MRLLLVSRSEDSQWKVDMETVLAPLGKVIVVKEEDVMSNVNNGNGDVVMVDATAVDRVEVLVSRLRSERPDCRIVVMTASPTWQRARAAFEAGAIDYLPKTLGKDELLDAYRQVLTKPLPPWPR